MLIDKDNFITQLTCNKPLQCIVPEKKFNPLTSDFPNSTWMF